MSNMGINFIAYPSNVNPLYYLLPDGNYGQGTLTYLGGILPVNIGNYQINWNQADTYTRGEIRHPKLMYQSSPTSTTNVANYSPSINFQCVNGTSNCTRIVPVVGDCAGLLSSTLTLFSFVQSVSPTVVSSTTVPGKFVTLKLPDIGF